MKSRQPSLLALALSLSVIAAPAVLLVGCGEEKPPALMASAKKFLEKKDTKSAVIQLKSALQQQPDLPEARFLLGRALLDTGEPVLAEVELRKALDQKYPESTVVPVLAQALLLQGKGQRVIVDYATTRLSEPAAQAELQTVLAAAYVQRGDDDKAQVALAASLAAVPDFTQALLLQARLKAGRRDFDGAYALLDRALAKDPANYQALQLKGDLLYLTKSDTTEAIELHRKALAQRADWLPSHTSIIEFLLAKRDIAGAKLQFAALQKVLPNQMQTKYLEARIAFLDKDLKTARELSQKIITVAPDNVSALLLGGSVELEMGSLAQAENLASRAVTRSPDLAVARRLLAQINLRSGEPAKAMQTLAPLLDRPDADAAVLTMAAEASLQNNDPKAAEEYFSRAAKLDPNDARSRTALALAQFSKGHPEVAFEQLQDIAASDKGTIADLAIIAARSRQRDFDAALKAIDALERKQPDKPLAAHLRGQTLLARNDPAGARQSFAKALAIDPKFFPAAAHLAGLDLRDKKPDDARKRFESILAIDPKNLQALLAIAELRVQAGGSREEVARLLAEAAKLNPTAPAPRLMLIELHLGGNDPKAAIAAAQDAIAAIPDHVQLTSALGKAQMANGQTDQAVASFNKLVTLHRLSPEGYLRLADAYATLKNLPAARDAVLRGIDVLPKNMALRRALIVTELAADHPEQAMAVARQVQTERPNEGLGHLLAGDIEASRKNWDAAAVAYRAGLAKDNGSTELAVKLEGVLITAKKRAEADGFAAKWIKDHPKDAVFRTYLGDLALKSLDFPAAETQYLAVVAQQPENAVALNNLAWIANRLKKPSALGYAEKALALRPEQPNIMDTMATILADTGDVRKALDLQKRAVALAPNAAALRLNLAKLYIRNGDKTQAKTELDQLAKLGDKFAGQAEVGELQKSL